MIDIRALSIFTVESSMNQLSAHQVLDLHSTSLSAHLQNIKLDLIENIEREKEKRTLFYNLSGA